MRVCPALLLSLRPCVGACPRHTLLSATSHSQGHERPYAAAVPPCGADAAAASAGIGSLSLMVLPPLGAKDAIAAAAGQPAGMLAGTLTPEQAAAIHLGALLLLLLACLQCPARPCTATCIPVC